MHVTHVLHAFCAMLLIGKSGYRQIARSIHGTALGIAEAIKEHPSLELLHADRPDGLPVANVVAWRLSKASRATSFNPHSTLIQPSFNPHSTLIQPSFNPHSTLIQPSRVSRLGKRRARVQRPRSRRGGSLAAAARGAGRRGRRRGGFFGERRGSGHHRPDSVR